MNFSRSIIKVSNSVISTGLLIVAVLTLQGCKEEVDLPIPIIKLNTESIVAPSLLSSFNVEVESNCDWDAKPEGGEVEWLAITEGKSVGNGELKFTLKPNTTSSIREVAINVCNEFNTVSARLLVRQNPSSGDGIVTISELRSLAGTSGFNFGEDAKMYGVVVSNMQYGNFPTRMIAVEGSGEANSGITIITTNEFLVGVGEEVAVDLHNATVDPDPQTGMLVLTPESDESILRTESTSIIPTPVDVTVPEILSGKYESMYVKVSGQIAASDISKEYLYEVDSFVDEEKNIIPFAVLPDCGFAESAIPSGSGSVCGVVGANGSGQCLYPCSLADLSLSGTRFDGGFSLPYIISLMTNSATNFDGRYLKVNINPDDVTEIKDFNPYYATTLDETGATVTWSLAKSSNYYRFWTDNSGHHNFQLGSWMDGQDNYLLFSYPSGIEFTDGFRLQFGWGGQKDAPRHWEVLYSVDGKTWSTGKTSTAFSLPQGVVAGSGKGFVDFTVDVYIDNPITKEDQLLVKIRRADSQESVSGGAIAASTGRGVFHSCMVLDNLPSKSVTSTPAGSIYFEPFDGFTEGSEYRLGDKLSALLNYAGSDISEWNEDLRRSMTGSNVRQRPGYAQIGYVNTVDNDHKSYKNEKGELITPELNAEGTYKLSFKAMAYKNKAVHVTAVKDIKGDVTQGIIEILGGGTINGQTKVSFGAMDYDSFKTFNYTIDGVTPRTRVKFTSAPGNSEYSRWFIDNICVKQ